MTTLMRAAHIDRYGPPGAITFTNIPTPSPRKGEALIRVEAAAVTSGDARIRGASFPLGFGLLGRLALGVRGPRKVPGVVFSGVIEQVGENVSDFHVGDAVAGMTGAKFGAHAEFVAVSTIKLARLNPEVTHAEAAGALFGGSTALQFLRESANVEPGQSVLVNGASGSVGSAAVQLASHFGAIVTAVSSRPNHDLVRRLGAEHVIDYHATPVSTTEEKFDVVFDAVGNISRKEGLRLATSTGVVILAVASLGETIAARGRVATGPIPELAEDFEFILDLVARGLFDPLVEIVGGLDALQEAHRRIDNGRKVGNLVVLPKNTTG